MARAAQSYKGRTFSMLTVVRLADERSTSGALQWVCQCECGGDRKVTVSALTSGMVKSCGCLKQRVERKTEARYLESKPKEISTIWLSMPLVGRSNQAIQEF